MEEIERIQGDQSFRCVSVKHVVNERKHDASYDFGKNKKGKKDEKTQEKQVIDTDQETTAGLQGTEQKEHDKLPPEENQCGNIIDIEA
ncbi:MAG: hypothetical protein HS132_19400 [Planctomycetia bacterium]|nr:hypothetical protein [Planctomycetia bacterium]MBE7447251.1 hypothetical protein [Planctomycetia bacterium]